ncbi:MAG: ornithine carbamoyltransferase [Candidatus Margulisbacteria bacterium]|nr:ornithine carbamoyltransferase [Candidatus Margulisiibacteriota bacterium]
MSLNHFINISDLSKEEIESITNMAILLKKEAKAGITRETLKGKSFALLFAKPSTRTFVSFHVAITQLGGHPISIHQSSMGGRESLHDVAKTLSRYVDGIIIRTFAHDDVEELAKHSSVPVINALTDKYHPCQIMADYLTIKENFNKEKVKVTYIGDGFNIANSLLLIASKTGIDITIASPKGFEPDSDIVKLAKRDAVKNNCKITITNDAYKAVQGADVVYTDTWTSMGMEEEAKKRIQIFANFQVNERLFEAANSDAIFMHCLPAHRGQEVTDEVIDCDRSVVFDQAENRLWTQKAILQLMYQ